MGGARETLACGLRIHENAGHVHFHDDKAGRKVEVPTAAWSKAWQALLDNAPDKWEFVDQATKLRLVVKTKSTVGGDTDVEAYIERCRKLSTYAEALDKFTSGGL